MSKKTPWIFVDCEARGTSPVHGVLTEFGAVHYDTRDTFHGRLFDAAPDPGWKRFRKTAHDHNPVNDAMGNVEAFDEILRLSRTDVSAAGRRAGPRRR